MSSESEDEHLLGEVLEAAQSGVSQLIPEKSWGQYEIAYNEFKGWCSWKKIQKVSKAVLLAYLQERLTLSTENLTKLETGMSGLEKGGVCSLCWPRKRGPGTIAVGPPQCPHSQISSTRSSIASSPHSQCPTPLPFLVNSGSVGGIVAPAVQLSPDQPFGSIRSLAAGREVASFPMSRTPTPPPSAFERSQNLIHVPDEERLVDSHFETVPVERNVPRKSVSIILPTEEKG
ncbi:hypothetical protein NQ317_010211 [Molorchus minor]|uniref:Uncharacterized protein n=1 Tax=Molorchus minor TaxID=1323400 RepID=A0ABQ9JPN2_9CUCU|nr:hypothetical protein NQ317_010211 [Molorchus minor]